MVRIFCIASLALAAVSAVSGHILRHRKNPPKGWETAILQSYGEYHDRYLSWGCQNKHNTTFFQHCCHPLLKGESIDAIDTSDYDCECEAGESSVPSSSVPSPKPLYKTPAPETSSTPSSSPSPTSSSAKFRKLAAPVSPPTSAPVTTTTSVVAPAPSSTPSNNGGNGGNGSPSNFGGFATYFYQNDNAGACGQKNSDDAFICAIDSNLYGDTTVKSGLCGKQVQIKNLENQKTVTVTIADACPTCQNTNSIDLSVAAFKAIAKNGDLGEGQFSIEWKFV